MTQQQLAALSRYELMELLRESVSRTADRQLFQATREEILRRLEEAEGLAIEVKAWRFAAGQLAPDAENMPVFTRKRGVG